MALLWLERRSPPTALTWAERARAGESDDTRLGTETLGVLALTAPDKDKAADYVRKARQVVKHDDDHLFLDMVDGAPKSRSATWWATINQVADHHADTLLATLESTGVARTQIVQVGFESVDRPLVEELRAEFRAMTSEFWTKGMERKIGGRGNPQEMIGWVFSELTAFLPDSIPTTMDEK